jgi:predicted secreted protein
MADYKVKLTRAASAKLGPGLVERVVWDATPEFSESRQVMYKNIDPTHAPGAIYQYANTGSRTFSIQGKFISRSVLEATKNLAYIQYLRTWAMPVFGYIGDSPAKGEDILGAPPAILLLTAYSLGNPTPSATDTKAKIATNVAGSNKNMMNKESPAYNMQVPAIGNNIFEVPVVITSLEIPYPSDVDYIPTVNQIPVPTIVTVTLQLTETHSPNKYGKFNLQAFKAGNLLNF